jgi:hypothetical protein
MILGPTETSTPDRPIADILPIDVRGLVRSKATALRTLAATMREVGTYLDAQGAIDSSRASATALELDRLEDFSVEPVPVRSLLVSGALSPKSFMVLMVNTFVRVLPTYAEIPLNLALHGAQGDLRNYGLIALNIKDEAGEGDPLRTHPALFNRSSLALSAVFDVPPISIRVGLAALILKLNEGKWSDPKEGLALVRNSLLQDEFGERVSAEQLQLDFDIACMYSECIAPEALECYRWRMGTLAEIVGTQLRDGLSHEGYLELISLLAVREAAAADPGNIFHCFSEMVTRYGGHLGNNKESIANALCWSDVHIDEEVGEDVGYEGHSVEDDHAEQALGAVLDHLYDDRDLLHSIRAMNAINSHLRALWKGTVRMMEDQQDAKLAVKGIPAHIHEKVRAERLQGLA